MNTAEILQEAGLRPDDFCPKCWSQLKRVLRVTAIQQAEAQAHWRDVMEALKRDKEDRLEREP